MTIAVDLDVKNQTKQTNITSSRTPFNVFNFLYIFMKLHRWIHLVKGMCLVQVIISKITLADLYLGIVCHWLNSMSGATFYLGFCMRLQNFRVT